MGTVTWLLKGHGGVMLDDMGESPSDLAKLHVHGRGGCRRKHLCSSWSLLLTHQPVGA